MQNVKYLISLKVGNYRVGKLSEYYLQVNALGE